MSSLCAALCSAAAPAADIELTSIVRDFQKSHADFDVAHAAGHSAGNLALVLAADRRPAYGGAGFAVGTEWTNAAGAPIAPHLFSTGGIMEIPVLAPSATPGGIFDTWNSAVGPYGGANVGPAPSYDVGGVVPPIVVPGFLAEMASQGDLAYSGTTVLYDHVHCDNLDVSGTLEIDGDVRILCDGLLAMSTHTEIVLRPGATLGLYLAGGTNTWNHTEINVSTGDPNLCKIYNLGAGTVRIKNHAVVYAQIISPFGELDLSNHTEFFGTFAGLSVDADNHSDFHLDTAPSTDSCGAYVMDNVGAGTGADGGAIQSGSSFDDWYRDQPLANLSTLHRIPLTDNGTGVYEFHSNAFYPIDGRLFGNEGDTHNNYFTLSVEYYFRYEACTGQFFQFAGSDDAWLFVENGLAIDLGGLQPGTSQVAELDRLGLVDGEVFRLNFFYAHRKAGAPSFHVATNIEPVATFVPGYTTSEPGD